MWKYILNPCLMLGFWHNEQQMKKKCHFIIVFIYCYWINYSRSSLISYRMLKRPRLWAQVNQWGSRSCKKNSGNNQSQNSFIATKNPRKQKINTAKMVHKKQLSEAERKSLPSSLYILSGKNPFRIGAIWFVRWIVFEWVIILTIIGIYYIINHMSKVYLSVMSREKKMQAFLK